MNRLKRILYSALKAGLAAFVGALAAVCTGCTAVVVPKESGESLSVAGVIPLGVQVNSHKLNDTER